jgi:hypothetical protein
VDFELKVVVGFNLEAVREEGSVVDGVAGFDDEVLKEQVHIWGADFQSWDRDILNGRDEQRHKDVDGVLEELWVGETVRWREDRSKVDCRLDHVVDVFVFQHARDGHLDLLEKGIDVVAKTALRTDLLTLLAKFLELFLRIGEELRIGQKLLKAVANVVHQILELGVVLLVAHDLLEQFLALLPLLDIAEALDEGPEVSQCSVGLLVLLHVVLCSFYDLLGRARVDLCVTLNKQAQSRYGLCVIVAFPQLQDCLLETVEHCLAFITG